MIPHYESKWFQKLDREDEDHVVEDSFEGFQEMYHAVWQDKFKDVIDLSANKFEVENSPAARRLLSMHVNDNVYKNLSKLSAIGYDKDMTRHKLQFSCPEKK